MSYLNEDDDARETGLWVEKAGRKAILLPGDIKSVDHREALVERATKEFGKIDILVNNAAFQRTYADIADISAEEWDETFRTNIYAPFYLAKAAVPHMEPASTILNRTSIQSRQPSPYLLPYASPRGAARTSRQASPKYSRTRESVLTPSRPARSRRLSSRRQCPLTRLPSSVSRP